MTTGDTTPYTDLIPSQNASQPNFVAVIEALTQGPADMQAILKTMPALYDLDAAIGVQLDAVGLWIGRSRSLSVPLVGVYFSFDDATVGFDAGSWFGPFDPVDGLTSLSDAAYRTYLKFGVAYNTWDGSIPGAYTALEIMFPDIPIVIQDNQDMSMMVVIFGGLDPVTNALFTTGQLDLRPAGVKMAGRVINAVAPAFGFDAEDTVVSGFDVGSFVVPSGGWS